MLSAALRYAEEGWPVFPCRLTKEPLTPNGFLDASTDPEQITKWWTEHPTASIGVPTGQISGFDVLDVDDLEGLALLPQGLPLTRIVQTGSGMRHIYFNAALGLRNRTKFLPGLDVRAEGGYVIMPPSLHPSGGKYQILQDADICDWPPWLLDLVRAKQLPPKPDIAQTETSVPEGGRNAYLTSVGGTNKRRGVSDRGIAGLLQIENVERCHPPLHEAEVSRIAQSVCRYPADNPIVVSAAPRSLSVTNKDIFHRTAAFLRDKARVRGQSTFLPGLDALLGGGKRLGEVTVWHAVAKTGKNTLWHKLIQMALNAGLSIGYATRELTADLEVLPDLLSIEFQENALTIEATDERMARYEKKAVADWSQLYYSVGLGTMVFEDLRDWMLELKAIGVRYFYVDHLHFILEDPEEYKLASKAIRNIKIFAREQEVHVDIIVQPIKLNQEINNKLSADTLRGGAAIAQAVDNIIILERVEGHRNLMRLKLEVSRSKLSNIGEMYLSYDPKTFDSQEAPSPMSSIKSRPLPPPPFGGPRANEDDPTY